MKLYRYFAVKCVFVFACAIFSEVLNAADQSANNPADPTVEHVTEKPQRTGNGLGTRIYSPSEKERPFFEKLALDEINTTGKANDYDITKHKNKYVGWFGIVREIKEDTKNKVTILLVEQKFFDGLTDMHIQSLSFDGSGDFKADVPGTGYKIQRLTLVKVYGVAKSLKGESLPKITADFIKNWEWGTFTFMFASENQRGNPKWRKLNTVKLDDIYDPYPDDAYFESRLGKR